MLIKDFSGDMMHALWLGVNLGYIIMDSTPGLQAAAKGMVLEYYIPNMISVKCSEFLNNRLFHNTSTRTYLLHGQRW